MSEPQIVGRVTSTDSHAFLLSNPFIINRQQGESEGKQNIMKRLFLLSLYAVFVLALRAQTSQIASLYHEGEVTVFYNGNGLKDAYAAAADGDIITLSSGTFASTNLTGKKVTIRGAGMEDSPNRTVVTGTFKINIPRSDDNASFPMSIEGVYFKDEMNLGEVSDFSVIKCGLKKVYNQGGSASISNCTFLHCIIKHWETNCGKATNISFQNCYIGAYTFMGNSPIYKMDNCTIEIMNGNTLRFTYLTNCLIYRYNGNKISDQGDAVGCVSVGGRTDIFDGCSSDTNRQFPAETEFFNEEGKYYELKDDIAAEWLGNDGTQVGMHGGRIPFDPQTTNPQITRFDVSSKTTPDGKLAVDIEVKTY